MSEFVVGLSGRHAGAAKLAGAIAATAGFEAVDLRVGWAKPPSAPDAADGATPRSFAPQAPGGPRHFAPLDPDANPTEGWNPFDADGGAPEGDGFVDPIEAARAAGYAEGAAAAQAAQAAERGGLDAFGRALAAAFADEARVDRDQVARQLRQTVMYLVTRLVGETGVSADLLNQRVGAAVDLLADAAESAILRLHPDDMALVDGKLPKTVFAVADAALERGAFALESASTIIEDGPSQWLEQLAQAVDRVGPPQC